MGKIIVDKNVNGIEGLCVMTLAVYELSKAVRSENSRLVKSKLVAAGFTPLPTWQDAVKRYLQEAQL